MRICSVLALLNEPSCEYLLVGGRLAVPGSTG
ncbi:hypothetical protein SBA2_130003 [Acidobacteriia bacterium SbA2]|nr:hypothetical protein SBA2_130003 [Acidobacteriia bacterium SbA2]